MGCSGGVVAMAAMECSEGRQEKKKGGSTTCIYTILLNEVRALRHCSLLTASFFLFFSVSVSGARGSRSKNTTNHKNRCIFEVLPQKNMHVVSRFLSFLLPLLGSSQHPTRTMRMGMPYAYAAIRSGVFTGSTLTLSKLQDAPVDLERHGSR
jgi:hypothetical protein